MLLKKKIYSQFLLAATLLMLFAACKKNKSVDDAQELPVQQPVNITTSVQGRVLDRYQQPLQGAAVNIGKYTTTTGPDGYFLLDNVSSVANATTVHIQKEGYFNGSRTIVAGNNSTHFVQVELLPRIFDWSFSGVSGGKKQFSHFSLEFTANQVLEDNNMPYAGNVKVAYHYLNPESSNFFQVMPGDLRGFNTSGKEVGLQSYGMIAVELLGSSGEKLHLDSTKPVTITLDIPPSMANAPSSIPLWYFNEETGFWKEEGTAVKQGNAYVGKVRHFSFWNCDVPFPQVDFKAKFQDQHGASLTNLQVQIISETGGAGAYGYVAGDGTLTGKIPENMKLKMKVSDARCGTELYTTTIGPFKQASDLGIFKIDMPERDQLTLKGAVTNCLGKEVAAGSFLLSVDGVKYRSDFHDGKYSITVSRCNHNKVTAELFVYDSVTTRYTTLNVPVNNGTQFLDVSACNNIAGQYVHVNFNNQTTKYITPGDSITVGYVFDPAKYQIRASKFDTPAEYVLMTFDKSKLGPTKLQALFLYHPTQRVYFMGKNDSITVNVTKIEDDPYSDYNCVEGNLSGLITDSLSTPVIRIPVSIAFRVANR